VSFTRVWPSLVPSDFLTEAEAFYQSHKSEKQIAIPEAFADLILQEAPLTYEGVLRALNENGRARRVACGKMYLSSRNSLGRHEIC